MDAWNPRLEWQPKDLRNCLPTFEAREGLLTDVVEQYLGHAPRTVTARHHIPRLGSVHGGGSSRLSLVEEAHWILPESFRQSDMKSDSATFARFCHTL
ncbi:MAG: hypothetical protein NTW86_15290 [Candidatus Sumerlaeota bacterium]|nr:hypothetical protein [Candidatus Sumerlaeota bacterium]